MTARVFYKATSTDGTDFHSGTVNYAAALASAARVDVGAAARRRVAACCTDAVLHASDVATETLIGGAWPCRLFEVTGRPVAQSDHKFGFRSLRVVREVDGWEALGPEGREVAALIERTRVLTGFEAESLDAARDAARGAVRFAAWFAARGAARDAAWDAARFAARGAARDAAWGAARFAARGAARFAAWGAADGLVVRDLISTERYDALTLPWRTVVGRIHPDDAEVGQ